MKHLLITPEVLLSSTTSSRRKNVNESQKSLLKKLTHVKIQGNAKRVFVSLEGLEACRNLQVLYAYDNEIPALVPALKWNVKLTHLYLQNNKITKMEFLTALPKLRKLYLDGNQLSRIEGLEACQSLEELSISDQHPAQVDDALSFDPESLDAIGHSCRVLRASNCHLASTTPLLRLTNLRECYLTQNRLNSIQDIMAFVSSSPCLTSLEVHSNPFETSNNTVRSREQIIICSLPALAMLDTKLIDARQRTMMQTHMMHKHGLVDGRRNKKSAMMRNPPTNLLDLPPSLSSTPSMTSIGISRSSHDEDAMIRSESQEEDGFQLHGSNFSSTKT